MENLANMIEKEINLKKKRFHPLKKHLHQNGKRKNKPVVADHLLYYITAIIRSNNFSQLL